MDKPQSANNLDWSRALSAILILLGVGVIAASFVLPKKTSRRGAWSDDQAQQYQEASIKLHGLSHEIAHVKPDQEATVKKDLKDAQAEYDELRGDLESALGRPQRLAWILRFGGILLAMFGGGILFWLPEKSHDEST